MKKMTVVAGTILAMLVIMVFPCYGEPLKDENGCYKACYQKNNGQLRFLTGHKDECRQNAEVPFPLCLGGPTPQVPQICAGTVCYDSNTSLGPCTQDIESSCATVSRGNAGHYTITFDSSFDQPPVCVFYVQPDFDDPFIQLVQTGVQPSSISIYTFTPYGDAPGPVDSRFNFICTEP